MFELGEGREKIANLRLNEKKEKKGEKSDAADIVHLRRRRCRHCFLSLTMMASASTTTGGLFRLLLPAINIIARSATSGIRPQNSVFDLKSEGSLRGRSGNWGSNIGLYCLSNFCLDRQPLVYLEGGSNLDLKGLEGGGGLNLGGSGVGEGVGLKSLLDVGGGGRMEDKLASNGGPKVGEPLTQKSPKAVFLA